MKYGICLLVALGTFAAHPAPALPRFGVTATVQNTEFVARDVYYMGTPEVRWSTAGQGGLAAELPLRGGLALATGLEYGEHLDDSRWGLTVVTFGSSLNTQAELQTRLRTLVLPVRLEWCPGRWRLGAGPEVRYLVRADQRWPYPSDGFVVARSSVVPGRNPGPKALIFESVSPNKWYDATSLYRRWSLAAQFAAGREFPAGSHLLRADVRWSEGITHQQWNAGSTRRTRAAQLALGLLW